MRTTVLFLLLSITPALPAGSTPEQTVTAFYQSYRAHPFTGLPRTQDLLHVGPYLSPALLSAIKHAQQEQSRCAKAHSDEKPPWIEGDLFSSSFEGMTSFQVSKVAGSTVTVQFTYVEKGQRVVWKDDILLVRQGEKWVIDEIRYGNGGPGLRTSLSGKGC